MPGTLDEAVKSGRLLASSLKNIRALLESAPSDLYARVVEELVAAGQWDELNDRFYKTLEFGTGGLRGRTIGKIVTKAERGKAAPDARPEFPCVGTNAMNFANVNRATQGLVAYMKEWHEKNKMPKSPTMEQRIEWHCAHAKNCGCRKIEGKLAEEMKKRGIKF